MVQDLDSESTVCTLETDYRPAHDLVCATVDTSAGLPRRAPLALTEPTKELICRRIRLDLTESRRTRWVETQRGVLPQGARSHPRERYPSNPTGFSRANRREFVGMASSFVYHASWWWSQPRESADSRPTGCVAKTMEQPRGWKSLQARSSSRPSHPSALCKHQKHQHRIDSYHEHIAFPASRTGRRLDGQRSHSTLSNPPALPFKRACGASTAGEGGQRRCALQRVVI